MQENDVKSGYLKLTQRKALGHIGSLKYETALTQGT